jgi:hypothetical protein
VTRALALLVRAELTEAFVSVAEEVVAEAGPVDEDKMALLGCTEQPAVKGLRGLGSCRLTDRKVHVVAAVAAVVVAVHVGLEDNHFLTLFQLATYNYLTEFARTREQRQESGSLRPWQRWQQQWMIVLDPAEVAVVR